MKAILLIGATGVFGQRLAKHLAKFEDIRLILTSRDIRKATDLCRQIQSVNPKVRLEALALNTSIGLLELLRSIKPWLVIDASGPFQIAGYAVPTAAIKVGANYLDLADARQFLSGFKTLDHLAKAAGVVALSGASSTPALSSAVIADLTKGWKQVDCVDIAITPGGKSEVGSAVINAILSYAGKPIPSLENGHCGTTIAWTGSQVIDVPRLGKRRVAPVETADIELTAPYFEVQNRLVFHAGLESPIEQWGLITLAHIRRMLPKLDLSRLTPLLQFSRKFTRMFTGDRGAMMVKVEGTDAEGIQISAEWVLIANSGHGPNVPVMAAAAAVRALLRNEIATGAQSFIDVLPLAKITDEMKHYNVETSMRVISLS